MSRTHIPAELRRSMRLRARDCCEFCLIPETMTLAVHEIDHVIAEKHGGPRKIIAVEAQPRYCSNRFARDKPPSWMLRHVARTTAN